MTSTPQRRPTMATVAELAGTSVAVVSYVINDGPRNVAPKTRERVVEAIERSGYRPNRLARALASTRSHTLGLVVPDTTNAFFRDLSAAIQASAFDRDYLTLIGNAAQNEDHEQRYLGAFVDANVDGLIVASTTIDSWDRDLVPSTTRVVSLHKRASRAGGHTVLADDRHGAKAVVSHLLDHGHETVWCLTGPLDEGPMAERRKGWEDALIGAGRPAPVSQVIRSDITALDAARSFSRSIGDRPAPTAMFVATDEQALGVIHAVGELGLTIPGDLAVASFDGTNAAEISSPTLTTARAPIAEMADLAVSLAVGNGLPQTEHVLPVELRIGRSCGCIAPSPNVFVPRPTINTGQG